MLEGAALEVEDGRERVAVSPQILRAPSNSLVLWNVVAVLLTIAATYQRAQ